MKNTIELRGGRRLRACASECRLLLACAAISLSTAAPAMGTVAPSIKIRMPADTKPARSGQEYRGTFEIDVGRPGLISDVRVSGRGWRIHAVHKPAAAMLAARARLAIPFRATPTDAEEKIEISVTFEGMTLTRSYRLGPQAFAQSGKDRQAMLVAPGTPVPSRPPALRQGESPRAAADYNLRFKGRLVYARPTSVDNNGMPNGPTTLEGVDGVWVEVMDEDTIDSETIWSGTTDPDGYFDSGNIVWDDCDISGCDDPDIYVRWECDTGVVNVQDAEDIFEPDFSWSNVDNVIDDFTGNFHDFGTLQPADAGQMPVLHIHNSITRAWRYILNKSGTGISVAELDVLWPDGNNAFYTSDHNEIHIGAPRQWNEGTHTHEYGHHFLHMYSVNPTPEYCNGFCDDGSGVPGCYSAPTGQCGHCVWCRETDHDAWNEGWPNWLADVVTRDYPQTYAFSNGTPWTALNSRSQEALGTCCQDNQAHDPLRTEGFVGALLRDMEDATQDDHDGDATFDCDVDAMAIGPEEIFAVVVQDKPSNVAGFLQMFRDRFPEHDQDLWSTTRNVAMAYGFPLPVPQVVTISNGCSSYRAGQRVELRVNGNGSLLQYQWRRNFVNLANGGRISGANTPTLIIEPSESGDGGIYNCLVTTCDGTYSYPSLPIRVHVFPAPIAGMAALGFGRNHAGQTGRGTLCSNSATCAATPEPVISLANFADIGAFEWHTVGVLTDGSVWGWGSNGYGAAVGHATTSYYLQLPELVPEVTNAVAASAGELHSVALRADGKVFAWGYNGYGALGVADPGQFQPIEVPGAECTVAVDAGWHHTLALMSDGTVWAWGSNHEGQLGRGSSGGWNSTPAPVSGLSDVVAIAAGGMHNLAIKSDGTVWAWGWNSQGQLGDGSLDRRTLPYQVPGLSVALSIAASPDHSMAVLADGSARVWGAGGKLGDGTVNRSLVPVTPIGMNSNVIGVSGGSYHTLFLRDDGAVWGCGYNYSGQLAQPGQTHHLIPFQIAGLSDIRGVTGWGQTSFVLTPGVAPSLAALGTKSESVGAVFTWNTAATGTPTLSYQWKRGEIVLTNGGRISGSNTASLKIDPLSLADAGAYTCTVTNGYGADSETGILSVSCIAADFNCDEHVDNGDVAMLADCVTGPAVPGPPPGCTPAQFAAADFDDDGDVDADDFGRFQRCVAGPEGIPRPDCAP